mmetsp:Transcript_96089/g.248968  ORF Transcript_96089/g.248968 Transcript_96089/m.248968 type:complete len:455 (+) Transcript_96089:588-1952(+)
MRHEEGRVDLVVQLDLNRHGQGLETCHVVLLHPRLPTPVRLEELRDSVAQRQRDLVVDEEAADEIGLPHLLVGALPALIDERRGAPEQRGKDDEAYEEHTDGEGALLEVVRVDVHGGGSELGHRPVICSDVMVKLGVRGVVATAGVVADALQVVVEAIVEMTDPIRLSAGSPDGVPQTRDEVRQDREAGHQLGDVEEGQQRPAEQHIAKFLEECEELHDSQQPEHTEAPRDADCAQRLAHAGRRDGFPIVVVIHQERQIHQHDAHVARKPRPKVPTGDRPEAHLDAAVVPVEAHEEVPEDVHGPEDRGGHARVVREMQLVVREHHEGQRQQIVHDGKCADDVPYQAFHRCRRDHQALQAVLVHDRVPGLHRLLAHLGPRGHAPRRPCGDHGVVLVRAPEREHLRQPEQRHPGGQRQHRGRHPRSRPKGGCLARAPHGILDARVQAHPCRSSRIR